MLGYWFAIFFVSIFSEVITTLYYCAMNAKVKHRTVFWSGIVSLVNLLLYRSVFREQGNAGLWLVSAMFLGDVIGTYLALTLEEHRDARRLAEEAVSPAPEVPQAVVHDQLVLERLQAAVAALSSQVAAQQVALASAMASPATRHQRSAPARRRSAAVLGQFSASGLPSPLVSLATPPSVSPHVFAASPSMPGVVRRPTRPPLILPDSESTMQVA